MQENKSGRFFLNTVYCKNSMDSRTCELKLWRKSTKRSVYLYRMCQRRGQLTTRCFESL